MWKVACLKGRWWLLTERRANMLRFPPNCVRRAIGLHLPCWGPSPGNQYSPYFMQRVTLILTVELARGKRQHQQRRRRKVPSQTVVDTDCVTIRGGNGVRESTRKAGGAAPPAMGNTNQRFVQSLLRRDGLNLNATHDSTRQLDYDDGALVAFGGEVRDAIMQSSPQCVAPVDATWRRQMRDGGARMLQLDHAHLVNVAVVALNLGLSVWVCALACVPAVLACALGSECPVGMLQAPVACNSCFRTCMQVRVCISGRCGHWPPLIIAIFLPAAVFGHRPRPWLLAGSF